MRRIHVRSKATDTMSLSAETQNTQQTELIAIRDPASCRQIIAIFLATPEPGWERRSISPQIHSPSSCGTRISGMTSRGNIRKECPGQQLARPTIFTGKQTRRFYLGVATQTHGRRSILPSVMLFLSPQPDFLTTRAAGRLFGR